MSCFAGCGEPDRLHYRRRTIYPTSASYLHFYSARSNVLSFESANEFLKRKYKKKNWRVML